MKALTLTQPWASLMALGYKQVETRSWKTQYRGPLAIHAAKGYPASARRFAEWFGGLARTPRGAVVCTLDLVDCQPTEEVALRISDLELHLGDYAPGRWAWLFDSASLRLLPDPIPARGALSLWEWESTQKKEEGS